MPRNATVAWVITGDCDSVELLVLKNGAAAGSYGPFEGGSGSEVIQMEDDCSHYAAIVTAWFEAEVVGQGYGTERIGTDCPTGNVVTGLSITPQVEL